jgi:hypothetical protein
MIFISIFFLKKRWVTKLQGEKKKGAFDRHVSKLKLSKDLWNNLSFRLFSFCCPRMQLAPKLSTSTAAISFALERSHSQSFRSTADHDIRPRFRSFVLLVQPSYDIRPRFRSFVLLVQPSYDIRPRFRSFVLLVQPSFASYRYINNRKITILLANKGSPAAYFEAYHYRF